MSSSLIRERAEAGGSGSERPSVDIASVREWYPASPCGYRGEACDDRGEAGPPASPATPPSPRALACLSARRVEEREADAVLSFTRISRQLHG
jgi:hypothetical protein